MEKFKVELSTSGFDKDYLPDTLPSSDLVEAAEDAGWSSDPGTGSAVMLSDANGNAAYEVHNPVPIAPPIGWEPTPPVEILIRDRVKAELAILKDDEEIDDIIDAENFDIPDEEPPLETMYEFIAMEKEAPAVSKEPSAEERIKAELDYEDLKARERRSRERRSRAEYERRRADDEQLYGPEPVERKPSKD